MSPSKAAFAFGTLNILVLLAACNGSSSTPSPLAGMYSGSAQFERTGTCGVVTPPTAYGLYGAVGPDGNGYFIPTNQTNSDVNVFVALQRTGTVDSAEAPVPGEGQPPEGSTLQMQITQSSSTPTTYAMQGSIPGNCGSLVTNLGTDSTTYSHQTLDTLSGSYTGYDVSRQTAVAATLDGSGVFTGTDAMGCKIAGTLSQVDKLNLFGVTANITGAAGCHGSMTGVAFRDTTDQTGEFSGVAGTYLYLMGADYDLRYSFAMELKTQ